MKNGDFALFETIIKFRQFQNNAFLLNSIAFDFCIEIWNGYHGFDSKMW